MLGSYLLPEKASLAKLAGTCLLPESGVQSLNSCIVRKLLATREGFISKIGRNFLVTRELSPKPQ
jgi:hypothetical protein